MQHVAELTISLRMRRQTVAVAAVAAPVSYCCCCQLSVGRVAWVYANCSSFSYGFGARGERLLATHDHDHCPATALAAAASASAAQLLSSSCSGRLISIANIFTYSQCQLPQTEPQPPVSPSPAAICCPGVDNDNVAHSSCFGCIFINGLPFRFYVQLYFSLARYFSLPSTALALLHIWPLDLLFPPPPPASQSR